MKIKDIKVIIANLNDDDEITSDLLIHGPTEDEIFNESESDKFWDSIYPGLLETGTIE
jgi:hypothetical protein